MANNYIEEFFISIGFDTKKVKKEAKEIDRVLDNLVNKKRKVVSEEAKLKKKLHTQTKKGDTDNFKHFLSIEEKRRLAIKKTEQARRKQAVGMLTAGTGGRITAKTSMFTPLKVEKPDRLSKRQVQQKLKADIIEAENIKDARQHNRYIKRKRHRAALASKRKADDDKSIKDARKALHERLRLMKQVKAAAIPAGRTRAQGMVTRFKESVDFRGVGRAQKQGLLDPNFNTMLDKAAMDGNIRKVNELKAALRKATSAVNQQAKATRKLNTVQKGLNDSTRNMIRSYASIFALFQGTAAIKRVGQDFESLRASFLVVSENETHAAEQLAFVRKEAYRLGIDVRTAAKAFMGLSASAGDALGEKGVKKLFLSVLGISKAFGMSMDDTKGTFKAYYGSL